jgi:hypothetical protein
MPSETIDKRAAAREVIDILDEISTLLVSPVSSSVVIHVLTLCYPEHTP